MSSRDHPRLGTLVYRVQKECNVTVDCLLFVVIVRKYYPHRLKKKKKSTNKCPQNPNPKYSKLPRFQYMCCALLFTDPNEPLKRKANKTICFETAGNATPVRTGQYNATTI